MKKLILLTFIISTFTFSGGLMADRLDDLKAQYQTKLDELKADKAENNNNYSLKHIMHLKGIKSALDLAADFDADSDETQAKLAQKRKVTQEHLDALGDADDESVSASRAFFNFKLEKLKVAEDQNSTDPLFELIEKELEILKTPGTTPLTPGELQEWLTKIAS